MLGLPCCFQTASPDPQLPEKGCQLAHSTKHGVRAEMWRGIQSRVKNLGDWGPPSEFKSRLPTP